MNLSINCGELKSAVAETAKILANKNTLPILDNLLLEVNNNMLNVTGSDGETEITCTRTLIAADMQGAFCVNAKTLLAAINSLPEQPLTISIDGNNCNLAYHNGHYDMPVTDATEYPRVEQPDRQHSITLNAHQTIGAIGRAATCIKDDSLRPQINGVCIDVNNSSVSFVGTDAQSLAITTFNIASEQQFNVILPGKFCSLSQSIKVNNSDMITISTNGVTANISFSNNERSVISRLVEGRYPNYKAVVPTDFEYAAIVQPSELAAAIKRIQVCAPDSSSLIKMEVEYNRIALIAQDVDFNRSARETIQCNSEGNMAIGMNAKYLAKAIAIAAYNSSAVTISFNSPSRPVVVRPQQDEDGTHVTAMIMPMLIY